MPLRVSEALGIYRSCILTVLVAWRSYLEFSGRERNIPERRLASGEHLKRQRGCAILVGRERSAQSDRASRDMSQHVDCVCVTQ